MAKHRSFKWSGRTVILIRPRWQCTPIADPTQNVGSHSSMISNHRKVRMLCNTLWAARVLTQQEADKSVALMLYYGPRLMRWPKVTRLWVPMRRWWRTARRLKGRQARNACREPVEGRKGFGRNRSRSNQTLLWSSGWITWRISRVAHGMFDMGPLDSASSCTRSTDQWLGCIPFGKGSPLVRGLANHCFPRFSLTKQT